MHRFAPVILSGIAVIGLCAVTAAIAPGFLTYVDKDPFTITVSKGFPDRYLAHLAVKGSPFDYILDRSLEGRISADVLVPNDVTLGLSSRLRAGREFRQASMTLQKAGQIQTILLDLNLDGVWDYKRTSEPSQQFIFVDNEWLPVINVRDLDADTPRAKADYRSFVFSWDLGKWISDN